MKLFENLNLKIVRKLLLFILVWKVRLDDDYLWIPFQVRVHRRRRRIKFLKRKPKFSQVMKRKNFDKISTFKCSFLVLDYALDTLTEKDDDLDAEISREG